MSLNALQLTEFRVQKLQCIGGEGRAAPYRITTYRGLELGSTGCVMEVVTEASNSKTFEPSIGDRLTNLLRLFHLAS